MPLRVQRAKCQRASGQTNVSLAEPLLTRCARRFSDRQLSGSCQVNSGKVKSEKLFVDLNPLCAPLCKQGGGRCGNSEAAASSRLDSPRRVLETLNGYANKVCDSGAECAFYETFDHFQCKHQTNH